MPRGKRPALAEDPSSGQTTSDDDDSDLDQYEDEKAPTADHRVVSLIIALPSTDLVVIAAASAPGRFVALQPPQLPFSFTPT